MIYRLANYTNYKSSANGPPPQTLFAFIKWCTNGTWGIIVCGAILSAIAGAFEMFTSIAVGWVVDAAHQHPPEANYFNQNWVMLIGATSLFVFFRPLSFVTSALLQAIVNPIIRNMVLLRLHRYTLSQSVSFFENDFAGRISQKELNTASQISNFIVELLHTVMFALASIIAAMSVLGSLNQWTAVFLFIWIITYSFVIRYYMPRVRSKSRMYADANAGVIGHIIDVIGNIKTVKLFAHASHENDSVINQMDNYLQKALDRQWVLLKFRTVLIALASLLPIGLVGITLLDWQMGQASIGQLATAAAIALRLTQMTGWVSFTIMGMYAQIGEIEDGMRTLSPTPDLIDEPNAQPISIKNASIEFKNVAFKYGRKAGGIENLNMKITSGEKVGIVGASGAGKSTLVNLLLRFYDVENGQILISDQNVAHVSQDSLRHNIAMVTQDTSMFNRSAYDNILYGCPNATKEEVINAAKDAHAHDFIVDLQDNNNRCGYDAHLGERGVKLSGGQRQRIALARAILKNAPILILDEATSALDSEVEAEIQTTLEQVMEGKTVLAVAHRLSTIARMDRIIVLDNGHIIEEGSHETLLAKNGLYARFWKRQSGGFIGVTQAAE